MSRSRETKTAVALLVAAALLAAGLAGCGGSGGPTAGPPASTGVSGRIVDADSGQGIGGMTVQVAGQFTGSSRAPDGYFLVSGVTPGQNLLVTIQPSALFVPVPGPQIRANVFSGQVTDVGTVFVIDPNRLPPSPGLQ